MNYKKAYEEALERAKEVIRKMNLYDGTCIKEDIEEIFPELREGKDEDERHRKWILEYLYDGLRKTDEQFKGQFKSAIDWLEKQKEPFVSMNPAPGFDSGGVSVYHESEDERIRKALVQYLKDYPGNLPNGLYSRYDFFTYLEKQKDIEERWLKDREGCFWDGVAEGKKQKEQKPTDNVSKEEYVKRFKALCDAYEIKLPNREYDIYHLCNDLSKLSIDSGEQKPIKWTDLTWKDIVELEGIINNVHYDFSAGIGQESFGKEVLERFRSTKGIEYLDEAEQKYWREAKQEEQKPVDEKIVDEVGKSVRKKWALDFINYLDANRFEGKMNVSNAECEDIEEAFFSADWEKIYKYYNKYLQKPVECSDEDAEKAAREYADENPGIMNENDGSVFDDYDTPYYNFLAGYRWTKSHIRTVNTTEWKPTEEEILSKLPDYTPTNLSPYIEQSQEWSDEDNIGWDEAFACVTRAEKAAKNEEELQNAVTAEKWLKEIKFKYYVHPVKPEWSDEDRRAIDRACVALRAYANGELPDILPSQLLAYADRLQSLRPQPKPTDLPAGFYYIDQDGNKYYSKEFRYGDMKVKVGEQKQAQWKPSEAQMEALQRAIDACECEWAYEDTELRSLLSDLKKLKEE